MSLLARIHAFGMRIRFGCNHLSRRAHLVSGSVFHLVFGCPTINSLWQSIPTSLLGVDFSDLPLKEWLLQASLRITILLNLNRRQLLRLHMHQYRRCHLSNPKCWCWFDWWSGMCSYRFPSFFLQEYRHHIDSSSEILENSKRLCALRTTLVMTRQVQSENTDVTKMLSSSSAYISFSLVRSIVPLCTDDWSVEFKH
ncbi:hypothetical protein V6N12_007260 [Hibiscus sabdariffa]|uniref:Uncharacterized protein n=1 Tax=Hibiscus sabdariffa TaxID=183260 RepID=A0ABR2F1B0_9ROSI